MNEYFLIEIIYSKLIMSRVLPKGRNPFMYAANLRCENSQFKHPFQGVLYLFWVWNWNGGSTYFGNFFT